MPISQIVTNSIANGAVAAVDLAAGAALSNLGTSQLADANMAPGSVIQVVQAVKTDAFAGSAGALWADISGLSASITPASASNRILIIVDLKGAGQTDATVIRSRLLRNNTPIYVGDAASTRPLSLGQFYISSGGAGQHYLAQLGGCFVDSPNTTSAVTYKVQYGGDSNASVVYINRTQGDRDSTYMDSRVASSITLLEIAA